MAERLLLEEADGWRLLLVRDEDAGDPRKEFDNYGPEDVTAWQEGDVWGYVIERETTWRRVEPAGEPETMTTWEQADACWGFYGYGYAEDEARRTFTYMREGD